MDTVPVAVVFTATPSCFQERDCFSGTASAGRIRWPPHNRGLSPVAGLPGPPLRPDATGSRRTTNARAPGPRSPRTFAYQCATGLPTRRGHLNHPLAIADGTMEHRIACHQLHRILTGRGGKSH